MYTPKCIQNGEQRQYSPIGKTLLKNKYYSTEEVQKILRNVIQPKLQLFRKQLSQSHYKISILNEKLNQNDIKLKKQTLIIQNLTQQQQNIQSVAYMQKTISQLLNDKLKQLWMAFQKKIAELREGIVLKWHHRIQSKMEREVERLKADVESVVQCNKKKNNAYWLKIKQVMTQVHNKNNKNQNELTRLNEILARQRKGRDWKEVIAQLQDGRRAAKVLVQLKRSVENLCRNYEGALNQQNMLRLNIEAEMSANALNLLEFNTKIEPLSFVDDCNLGLLEYSKEEPLTNQIAESKLPCSNEEAQRKADFTKSPLCHHSSYNLDLCGKSRLKSNNNMEDSRHKSQSQLKNYHIPKEYRLSANQSLSMINMSLQSRKEMSENAAERLLELIQTKGLQKPLHIELDEISYLKNSEGNYLFDLKGNMFKLGPEQLSDLQAAGLLKHI